MPRDLDRFLGDGGMPILTTFGAAFVGYGDGWSEATWTPTAECANPAGVVQAGIHCVVLDAAMNFAMLASLEKGERGATLEIKTSTMRPARVDNALRVRGEVVRIGKSVAWLRATTSDAENRVVADATATFHVSRA